MSRLLDIQPKVVVGVGIAAIVGTSFAYAGYACIKKFLENQPPKKWRKVGEISDLICFPIKSCGWIRINDVDCKQIGLESGNLKDRIFMVVKTNGEFITARGYPKLVQIMPKVDGNVMTLSAPGMMDIQVDIKRLYSIKPIRANVWGEGVDAVDAGEEVAKWFSRFILQEDFGLRLVFYPQSFPTRDVREKNKIFETAIKSDTGALHDATSFMLINESSIADLNTRLDKVVGALQFRPNFVVQGPPAYEEDSWKWIKIGEEVIFRNVKPCTRCLFTNIDPETAERDPHDEPLTTLKSYRKFKKTGESPVMGIHLGLRQQGKVKMGDTVYVEAS